LQDPILRTLANHGFISRRSASALLAVSGLDPTHAVNNSRSHILPPFCWVSLCILFLLKVVEMALFRLGIPSLLLFFLPFVATTCYHPDGTAVTDPAFQPCSSSSGTISMCCGTNRTESPDECLPNGLCHNPCATSGQCGDSSGGQYWRESCTDSSWRSPFCLQGACTNSPVSIRTCCQE
jgi:hypothetical protein